MITAEFYREVEKRVSYPHKSDVPPDVRKMIRILLDEVDALNRKIRGEYVELKSEWFKGISDLIERERSRPAAYMDADSWKHIAEKLLVEAIAYFEQAKRLETMIITGHIMKDYSDVYPKADPKPGWLACDHSGCLYEVEPTSEVESAKGGGTENEA